MATKEKLQCLKDFHKDILKPSPGKSPGTRPEDEAEGQRVPLNHCCQNISEKGGSSLSSRRDAVC